MAPCHELQSFPISNIPVGTDWSLTPSSIQHCRIETIIAEFVTSATAINRFINLTFKDRAGNVGYDAFYPAAQTATHSDYYVWTRTYPPTVPGTYLGLSVFSIPLPDVWLPPSWSIAEATYNLQVGDQWSNVVIFVTMLNDPWSDPAIALAEAQAGL